MKTRSKNSGEAVVIVLVVLGALGVGTWLVNPSWFPGASKRAAKSTKATADLVAATDKQGGAAAASVTKIGEVAGTLQSSLAKDFITSEVPVALSRLPAPDPIALLEAEKRRSAVMEGRADEARRLYEVAAKESAKLQAERDAALVARRDADIAFEKSAAAEHARTMQLLGAAVFFIVAVGAWLWLKFHSVSPESLGKMAADIRAGVNPMTALDTYVDQRLHARVNKASRLARDPDGK